MPMRIGAVVLSYIVYRVLEGRDLIGAIFVGIGSVLLAFSLIDRWTLRRRERLGLMQVGTTLLALGLLGLGLYRVLR